MSYYENEIKEYIYQKETNGAILLSGKWGCGKTYIANEIIDQINTDDKNKIAIIISLFGVTNVEQIDKKIKEKVFFGIYGDKLSKVNKNKHYAKTIVNIIKDLHPVLSGLDAALAINIYDYINIEKTIKIPLEKETNEKELIIFFDDIERAGIEIQDLFGKINEYLEGKKIKCVFIADEDKITANKYSDFKEKLISRTIKINIDIYNTVENIINTYNSDNKSYIVFLKDSISEISEVFENSESSNIRTLKSILIDFERIYELCSELELSDNIVRELLYYLSILKFEYNLGNIKKDEKYGYIYSNSELKNKYTFLEDNRINLYSLQKWIYEGEWNKREILNEISQKYSAKNISVEERFLYQYFWNLDQSVIDFAFPKLLDKAYNGELSCNEYIIFLERTSELSDLGIKLLPIDYSKIEEAVLDKENKIKLNKATENISNHFIHNAQSRLSKEAYEVYNSIEKLNERIPYYNNRNLILKQLESNAPIREYGISGKALVSFDEELMNKFYSKFICISNGQKTELMRSLIKINFDYSEISGTEEMQETITNLKVMIAKLEDFYANETDTFTKAITKSSIDEITKIHKNLSKKIKKNN